MSDNTFHYVAFNAEGEEGTESGYTYDRIVLGTLSALLCVFVLFQIIRTIYYKHKILSFHFFFLVLCFLWMTLRVIYWFLLDISCFILFLYWLPICIEFATFSLLLVFFTYALNSTQWSTPLLRPKNTHSDVTSTPDVSVPSPVNRNNRSPTSHTSLNTSIQPYYTNGSYAWENNRIQSAFDEYEAEMSINDEHHEHHEPIVHTPWYAKITDAILRRDVLYFTLFGVSNLLWFGVVLGMSIYVCHETDDPAVDIPFRLSIMSIIGASTFILIMVLLLFTGIRLAIRIRKQHDLPLSLKLSGLSGASILVVIGLNSLIFVTRVVVNVLQVLPNFPEDFFKLATLRMTDYGKMIIISSFVVWEIVPITTVLFFFSRIMPATSSQFHSRTPKPAVADDGLQYIESYQNAAEYNPAQEYYVNSRRHRPQRKTIFDDPSRYDSDGGEEQHRHSRGSSSAAHPRLIDHSAPDLVDVDTESDDYSYSSSHDKK
jgi:hypothetical protein